MPPGPSAPPRPLALPDWKSFSLSPSLLWESPGSSKKRAPMFPSLASLPASSCSSLVGHMSSTPMADFTLEWPFPSGRTLFPSLPGSTDSFTSSLEMLKISTLLPALWLIISYARPGGSSAHASSAPSPSPALQSPLLKILHKLGLIAPLLRHFTTNERIFAGPFDYHGNAGAFFNLCLAAPAAILSSPHHQSPRTWLIAACRLILLAATAFLHRFQSRHGGSPSYY